MTIRGQVIDIYDTGTVVVGGKKAGELREMLSTTPKATDVPIREEPEAETFELLVTISSRTLCEIIFAALLQAGLRPTVKVRN